MEKVFICYPIDDTRTSPLEQTPQLGAEQFVHRVSYYLNKQSDLESYCYADAKDEPSWNKVAKLQLASCSRLVFFAGERVGKGQIHEVNTFRKLVGDKFLRRTVLVQFPDCLADTFSKVIDEVFQLEKAPIQIGKDYAGSVETFEECAAVCAETIHGKIFESGNPWRGHDGLPLGYPFDYEKSIIEEFMKGRGRILTPRRLEQGCPIEWPEVRTIEATGGKYNDNPLKEEVIGKYRDKDDRIIVDARTKYHKRGEDQSEACLVNCDRPLTLMEAGPRRSLCYPLRRRLRVGVVVSGGIAPGINSVISGIVKRHRLYQKEKGYRLDIHLYRDGFSGLLRGQKADLSDDTIAELANRGGSMISTSRADELLDLTDQGLRHELLEELVNRLSSDYVDILYVIGGDGSMRAAHAIWQKAQDLRKSADTKSLDLGKRVGRKFKEISVVGIPKTMDNDILWVWQAFGFLSAVEKAKEFISQLDTETRSNPRLGIVQLFGSDSGFVVSHAALASNICRAALIPEVGFTMQSLSRYVGTVFERDYDNSEVRHNQSPHGMILLAETAIPRDVDDYIDNPQYPNLNLTEQEKYAIRSFIGSPLLSVRDVVDWHALCKAIHATKTGCDPGLPNHIWDSLPKESQDIVQRFASSDRETTEGMDEGIQSILVKALNATLKSESFFLKVSEQSELTPSAEIQDLYGYLALVKELSKADAKTMETLLEYLISTKVQQESLANPFDVDPETTFKELGRYLLSYEAKETTSRLLLLMSTEYLEERRFTEVSQRIWISHFKGYCRRLCKELVKTYNRLLFENALEGIISERRVPGECRVHGQTPDELRSGGLKVVSGVLQNDIRNCKNMEPDEYWKTYRVFVNEPRHLIRAIHPSVADIIFGQRLGTLAVDNAMAGFTDFMVSQWLTEYVLVPLQLVVLGRKRVPQQGIFWQSVLANTGQCAEMT